MKERAEIDKLLARVELKITDIQLYLEEVYKLLDMEEDNES